MSEAGDKKCCLTGRRLPSAQMLRLVSSPEGLLVLDFQQRLSDIAIWVEASQSLIWEAFRDGRFANSASEILGHNLKPENCADFISRIDRFLLSRCIGRLGLAKKAGQLVTGFERFSQVIGTDGSSIVFLASDASQNARQKLQKIAEAHQELSVIEILSGNELGSAVGRDRVVYGALKKAFAGQAFYDEVLRLGHFRGKAVPCAAPGGKRAAEEAENLARDNIGAEA